MPDLEERAGAPLTPGEIRQILRECVTVIGPGETLVVRVPWDTSWMQVREYQRVIDSPEGGTIPFPVLVVAGDGLGTAQPEPDFMARTTAEPLDGAVLTIRLTHEPTGISVATRDRAEGITRLRKALTDRARREYDLQWKARVAEARKAGEETPVRRGSDCPEHGDPLLWLGNGDLMCLQGHFYRLPDTTPPAAPSRRRTRRT